jgi:trigger factor
MTQTETPAEIEITALQQDAASRTYAVTVPVERIRATESATMEWYGKRARVPGFRRGHVPAPVLRRRYGDAIRQTVLEELLRESWEQARTRESLKPIGDPRVRNVKFEDGSPLTFELSVDVKPAIQLPRLGGFRLERRTPVVTDEHVDSQILALRERKAPWVPAEGRPRPGDLVEVEVLNLDAGAEQSRDPVRFVLGQGRAVPELEARIMELETGGTWEGAVRFPDDHPDEARRGLSRRLSVTLRELKRQELPELNEEFAREVGDFDSVEALRSTVRADLEAEARREAEARLRSELLEQIAAANNVAVPASLVERAVRAYAQAYGVPEERLPRFAGEFRPLAEQSVRRELIIEGVAEAFELAATSDELDSRVAEIARRRGESPAAVRGSLEQAGRLREMERSITEEKVFAHLLGLSTVEDVPGAR